MTPREQYGELCFRLANGVYWAIWGPRDNALVGLGKVLLIARIIGWAIPILILLLLCLLVFRKRKTAKDASKTSLCVDKQM